MPIGLINIQTGPLVEKFSLNDWLDRPLRGEVLKRAVVVASSNLGIIRSMRLN